MTNPTLQTILTRACEIAIGAGNIIKTADSSLTADFKMNEVDLVTEFDRRSEAFIVSQLQEAFPGHAIRGEEGANINSGADYEWLIDPIDGTTNFAHSLPIYSVVLALQYNGEVVVGVIYDPSRDEMFTAVKDSGTFLNGRPVKVSTHQPLARAVLVTGFPYDIRTNPDNNLARFAQFAVRSRAVRRLGSAALDLAYVACGRLDGYWEGSLHPWDVAAGTLMVREAGGMVTNYANEHVPIPYADGLLATNGILHDEMLRVLREGDDAPKPA
jgi:myo-inositol-1(or 4)-monophosphatase